MYKTKLPEKEKPIKAKYLVHKYDHNYHKSQAQWTDPYYQVVSIDPGIDNYAFRIERRYHTGQIIGLVYEKTVFSKELKEAFLLNLYYDLEQYLNKYLSYYTDCHYFIIEQQMAVNYQSVRIAQKTVDYFIEFAKKTPKMPFVVEINSKMKSHVLGAPPGMNRTYLKKWDTAKARELLTIRNDQWSLSIMDDIATKLDDLADTVIQIEAFFKLLGLPLTIHHTRCQYNPAFQPQQPAPSLPTHNHLTQPLHIQSQMSTYTQVVTSQSNMDEILDLGSYSSSRYPPVSTPCQPIQYFK